MKLSMAKLSVIVNIEKKPDNFSPLLKTLEYFL